MYAKVFAQIYDGTLCTKGPWQALVTFQQLLVLADQDGNVDMTAAAISRRTTIPLEIIEQGLAVLLEPDPESRTPTLEGRRIVPLAEGRTWGWQVVNYKHYRELKREEDRREYHRQYYREKRSKSSTLSTGTQHAQQIQPKHMQKHKQKNTQSEPVGSEAFASFWKAWPSHPRKVARKQCAAKWKLSGCDEFAPKAMEALTACIRSEQWERDGGAFIPAPLTWLNQARWEAESPKPSGGAQAADTSAASLEFEAHRAVATKPPSAVVSLADKMRVKA